MKTQQQHEQQHAEDSSRRDDDTERRASESAIEPEPSPVEPQSLFQIVKEIEDIQVSVVESQPVGIVAEHQVPEDMAKATIIAQYQRHEIVSDGGENQVEEISGVISMVKTDVDSQRLDEMKQESNENPIAQLNAISKLVAEIELANDSAQEATVDSSLNESAVAAETSTAAADGADNANDNNNEGKHHQRN